MKHSVKGICLFLLMGLLAGCLYPQERRQQLDQLPQHIMRVQSAVEAYHKENKVLPYKYTEDEYKLTTKYLVNFQDLQSYLGNMPPSSFEQGGNFLYVLINVEKKPTVRLFDLRVNDEIGKVQQAVDRYRQEHGKVPGNGEVGAGFYSIDFHQLGMDAVTIPSPYSAETDLPLLVDGKGKVYVDYRMEAMKMIQQAKKKPEAGQDLRIWLAEGSFYVPAFSPPMKYEQGEPVFVSVASG
ncbi:hypothetical protein [Lihuaxuella thermophila]|uniref:Uncharacterized protein n=1 Tax=Lihuaxuella thermophila TaxID=1173111 RepID=A0A1H8F6Z3_9BACL|nr:hypothetical protein [Lihuaxuella thermophila]SEN27681.1 hypothetical protein SAMN05444955_10852 [Lihuaxuella thermophila]